MQLDVHISGIQEVKTKTEVKTNKQTQEVKLMTVIQFESEVKPEALLDLYRLIEIDAPLNCRIFTDQSAMDFEQDDTGKITATLKG